MFRLQEGGNPIYTIPNFSPKTVPSYIIRKAQSVEHVYNFELTLDNMWKNFTIKIMF